MPNEGRCVCVCVWDWAMTRLKAGHSGRLPRYEFGGRGHTHTRTHTHTHTHSHQVLCSCSLSHDDVVAHHRCRDRKDEFQLLLLTRPRTSHLCETFRDLTHQTGLKELESVCWMTLEHTGTDESWRPGTPALSGRRQASVIHLLDAQFTKPQLS